MLRMIPTNLFINRLPQTATLKMVALVIPMVIFPSLVSLFDDEKERTPSRSIDDIFDDAKITAKSKCSPICQSDTTESHFVLSGNSDSGRDKK